MNSKKEVQTGFSLTSKIDPSFEIRLIHRDSNQFLIYLNSDGNLILYNLKDQINRSISLRDYIPKNSVYSGTLFGDTILLYNRDSTFLYLLNVNYENFTISGFKKINIGHIWENGKLIDRYQIKSAMLLIGNTLYIGYQTFNPHTSYLDYYSYLKLNIEDSTIPVKKILKYPDILLKGKFYNFNTHLVMMSDSILLYGFATLDSIYKVNLITGHYVKKVKMKGFNGFKQFNKKKIQDLGYIREYSKTSEGNFNFLTTPENNYIIVIKHLPKKKLNDLDQWGYCILNSELVQTYKGVFDHEISPQFCFSYEKGFLIFNKSLDKSYYYEVH